MVFAVRRFRRHCAACEPALKNAHVEGLDFIGNECFCNPRSNYAKNSLSEAIELVARKMG